MHDRDTVPDTALPRGRTATDPVCGMDVTVETAKHVASHDGETHYFCSAECREKFETRPELRRDNQDESRVASA